MRAPLAVGVLGALVGAALATFVTRQRPSQEAAAPPLPDRAAPPMVIPSSWDRRFLSRLSDVESRLQAVENRPAALAPESPPAAAPPPAVAELSAARTREIEQHYLDDLEDQSKRLTEHNQEPRDETWARPQTDLITRFFNAAVHPEHPLRVGRVDCRKATCVAELVYPSPSDAIADRGLLMRAAIAGCHSLSSALNPPTGPGEYTTTLIYDCRSR